MLEILNKKLSKVVASMSSERQEVRELASQIAAQFGEEGKVRLACRVVVVLKGRMTT